MIIEADCWKDLVGWDQERWPNFSPRELAQRGTGWDEGYSPIKVNVYSLDKLQILRSMLGRPVKINSAYRFPEYNDRVSSTGTDGVHTRGCAFDVSCTSSKDRYDLIRGAFAIDFTGIGVYDWGVHLDDDDIKARPRLWI